MRSTWRAVLAPKRLVPLLAIALPLLYAQARYSPGWQGFTLGLALALSFVAVAPVTYRVLFPHGFDLSHGAVRLVIYVAVGTGVVLSLGVAVPKILDWPPSFLTQRTSLLVCLGFFLVGGWGLGRDIVHEDRINTLQRDADMAQLLALKSQLDPHFLFNTLNAIAEWCRQDGAVAEAATLKLSSLLRAMFEGSQTSRWPLSRELELVRLLVDLFRLRDSDRYVWNEVGTQSVPEVSIPPFALLGLVENALKHGPSKGHSGAVTLTVAQSGPTLTLRVENPGTFAGPRPGGQGLPLLRRRLELMYGARANLVIHSAAGTSTTVAQFDLPVES